MIVRQHIEISDSQVKKFKSCEFAWACQYLLKIVPDEDKTNLIFGGGVHAGLEAVHNGSYEQEALDKIKAHFAKEGGDEKNMRLAQAMLRGYVRFFLPQYCANYRTVQSEGWFEYWPHEKVKVRGARDNISTLIANPSHHGVFDFKTTSFVGGGDLGKTVKTNQQLALYNISFAREYGFWPNEMGLIFLQKPKNSNIETQIERANNDPSLYSMVNEPVDVEAGQFAQAFERIMVNTGLRMLAIAQAFDHMGPSALDNALQNFESCYSYGRMCGFHKGCHSCRPAHHELIAQQGPTQ